MNNFDVLNNNNSIVRCKDCTNCLILTNEEGGTTRFCRQIAKTYKYAVMVSGSSCCADGFIFDGTTIPNKRNAEIINENKDSSELVRCKDCVHCRIDHQGGYDYYICDRLLYPSNYPGREGLTMLVDSNFFCDYGATLEDYFEEEEEY